MLLFVFCFLLSPANLIVQHARTTSIESVREISPMEQDGTDLFLFPLLCGSTGKETVNRTRAFAHLEHHNDIFGG